MKTKAIRETLFLTAFSGVLLISKICKTKKLYTSIYKQIKSLSEQRYGYLGHASTLHSQLDLVDGTPDDYWYRSRMIHV